MRHFRSILYAVVLAPAVWVLAGVGLTRDLTTRGRDEFAVETITGVALLVLAGAAYAILVFAPISPAGPTLAGLVYLGVAIWALQAPSSYADVWPAGVAKEGFDLSRPGYGLAALLAVPMIGTALSARRWRRYEPPVLPLVGQIGRARGAAQVVAPPMEAARTTLLPGRRTDPDPTTVLRLPPADAIPTMAKSSASDATVTIHTTDDETVSFTNDPTVAVDNDKTETVTTTAPASASDDPTVAVDNDKTETDTSSSPASVSTSSPSPATSSSESSRPVAPAPTSSAPTAPPTESSPTSPLTPTVSSLPAAPASPAGSSPDAAGEEPTEVVADGRETAKIGESDGASATEPDGESPGSELDEADAEASTTEASTTQASTTEAGSAEANSAEASSPGGPAKAAAASSDDEPTEPVVASQATPVDDETTGTLGAPDPDTTRPIPLPRAVPAIERLDEEDEPTLTLHAASRADDDEPTQIPRVSQRPGDAEDATPSLRAVQQPDDEEPTRTLGAAPRGGDAADVTRSLRAVQSGDEEPTRMLRVAPQPDDDEPTRTLWAVDSDDRTDDLGGDSSDGEQTRVIRLPVGDQAERTQVVRIPPATGPTTYRPGEQTRVIPFPGTGDVGGDETQIIRLPVRSSDGENTQVIRPGLVEAPERTEVIRLPLRTPENTRGAEVGESSGRTGNAENAAQAEVEPDAATRQPSIVEAEAPDIGDDPTSRLEPSPPRTDDDAERPMTVMKMERPPED